MPTVQDVCDQLGLADVDLTFEDEDYQNLQTYKQFQQHVRPILQKENPKIAVSKLMMLVAAKWRDFEAANPYLEQEEDASKAETTVDTSRAEEEYDEEDDEDSKSSSKKSRRSNRKGKSKGGSSSSSSKSKVPTLKIRIGKRKRGSSVSVLDHVKQKYIFIILVFFLCVQTHLSNFCCFAILGG